VEIKTICNLLFVVLMLSLVVVVGGCGAKFQLSSLEVSPKVCLSGDTVTVLAILDNSGGAQGEYTAELLLDSAIEQTQTLTVEPGSSHSVSFTLTKEELGTHVVQLGELTASFTVLEVSNLNVSPSKVEVDQPVTVSANLRNVADTQATINCCLLCQGAEVAAKDITLASGSIDEVTFTLSQGTPGMYEVQLGNLSASFKVLKPAGFEVISFDILPNPVKVGEETTITLSIENVGEIKDTYTATLVVDGVAGETRDINLAGGATETVSFSLSKDSPGSYNIELGVQETILRVWQPPPTGTFFFRHRGGRAALEIENRYSDLDVVAVLCKPEEPVTPWIAFYVQAGDTYTARRIRHGYYLLYFTLGVEWDDDLCKFLTGATYHRYEDVLKFFSTAEQKTTWIFELGPEEIGWQISEGEFPVLK
jgi:hypothetical protein